MAPSRGRSGAANGYLARIRVALAVPLILFSSSCLLPGVDSNASPGAVAADDAPAKGVVSRDELQQFLLWLRRNAVFGIGDTVRYLYWLCSLGLPPV